MRVHSLLFPLLMLLSLQGWGQSARVGVGTDPAMWVTGWRNVQLGWQFHEEASVVAGAGWMNGDQGVRGLLRPRPVGFDLALMGSIGLRFHPQPLGTSRVSGVVGLDFSQEMFQMTMDPGGPGGEPSGPVGVSQYQRSDVRMLAGARARLGTSVTLSAHASVGYVFGGDDLQARLVGIPAGTPPVSRILSLELMRWF